VIDTFDKDLPMQVFRCISRTLFATLCGALTIHVAAQDFPNKAISVVVPYPAGGPSDYVARQLQPELNKALNQPVLVENIGGVGGAIGIQKVLSAPADGYQLTLATPMELVLAPLAMSAVKFKPEDMKVVGRVGITNMVLLTRKDLPANNIEELIALMKKPGAKELSYGSVGPGSLYHLIGEKFAQVTGSKMLHVPYKGAAPLITDLMGGQIDMVFTPLAGGTPGMINDGKVKGLGITSRTPHPKFPQLPALAAVKGLESFEFDLWIGLQVSAKTPADVSLKLNKAIYEALQNPTLRGNLESTGSMVGTPMSPDELARMYNSEITRYQTIAKSINLQPQ
jgi:tripartite-type tricarboxylate transporter receptor subunit TctC